MRPKIAVERSGSAAVSLALWSGLVRFNREQAGRFDYRRTVISARDGKRRLLGGLILQSYWRESYIELLWLSPRARGAGLGTRLIEEAERRARLRGSRHIYLSTYSFQAPGFYEGQGYRRFGTLPGSPRGARRYYYMKRLRQPRK
jgi:ribosomal protein S18 acetylase RimI-like enzyme